MCLGIVFQLDVMISIARLTRYQSGVLHLMKDPPLLEKLACFSQRLDLAQRQPSFGKLEHRHDEAHEPA